MISRLLSSARWTITSSAHRASPSIADLFIETPPIDLCLWGHSEDHEGPRTHLSIDRPPATASRTWAQLAQSRTILALDRAAVRSAEPWTDRFELLPRVLDRRTLGRIGDRGTLVVGRRMPQHFVWRPRVGCRLGCARPFGLPRRIRSPLSLISSSSRYQSPGMAPRPIPVRWLSHRQISIRGVSLAGSSPVAHVSPAMATLVLPANERLWDRGDGFFVHAESVEGPKRLGNPAEARRVAPLWLARDELNDGDLTSGLPSPVAIDRELGEDTIGEIPKPL